VVGEARVVVTYRAGGWRVEVTVVLANSVDLDGAESRWGVMTDEMD
jgi:hypothetical protein